MVKHENTALVWKGLIATTQRDYMTGWMVAEPC